MTIDSLHPVERERAINYLKPDFERFQYRQELHDRFYHKDIYVLPKGRRLVHLVLHHAKYVSRIFELVEKNINAGLDKAQQTLFDRTLVDGIIVSFSMLNTLDRGFVSSCCGNLIPMVTTLKDSDETAKRLVVVMGEMAKTVEDIDHLAHVDVNGVLTDRAVEMIKGYAGLLIGQHEHWQWPVILSTCEERLIEVEKKHFMHRRFSAEITSLMDKRS